jgi:hypothetical protein
MASRLRMAVFAFAGAAVAMLVVGHDASATSITLGIAANYGLLTGLGETTNIGGGFKLTGNLGLATGYNVTIAGTNSQTGITYYDGSNGGGQFTDNGTYSTGGASVNQSMTSTLNAAYSAASAAAAATATTGLTDQGGSISLSGSSVTIKALTNLSENVLDISTLSLTNSTLTFDDNGFTGAKFIVNITGGFSVSSSGSLASIIQGINGASASDIIFNIEGTGSAVSITGNSTNQVIGTILAPSRNVTIGGGGTLTGELLAGVNNLGNKYTLTEQSSGFNLKALSYVPQAAVKTPEPSSIALFGAGGIVLLVARRRRRATAKAD